MTTFNIAAYVAASTAKSGVSKRVRQRQAVARIASLLNARH